MKMNKNDLSILRELGKIKAECASEDKNAVYAKQWKDTNDLKLVKPPVYINEIPWHEMNVNDELTNQCLDPFCQRLETNLRREIYSYKHMPGNMVMTSNMDSQIVINDSGFGIGEDTDIVKTDEQSNVVSRHFNIQIQNEDDIAKIKDPIISVDKEKSEEYLNLMKEIFDGILNVRQVGVKGQWFTPWDNLIRLTGVTEAMMDLVDRPDYINKLVARFVDASLVRLEKYEELGLWASNNGDSRVGSGGYGYSSDLDDPDKHLINAPTNQLWGCGNSQIFSEVSPNMHWEFSLKHEMRWLERFGLTYYGCCEPLSNKISILDRVPNLRKISMSYWAKLAVAAEQSKGKYVLSYKPTPAIFTDSAWNEELAINELKKAMDDAKGCSLEIIMKDISTVCYKPEHLWRWSELALETADKYCK